MTIKTDNLKKIDWDVLNIYIENNLIVANKHLDYDIWVLSYSPKVASKNLWDEYTTSCRGLVIDSEGKILARPFKKFKNLEEYNIDEIPQTPYFNVFEKYDGTLIILFYYEKQKEWIVCTKYSFISSQTLQAYDILKDKLNYKFDMLKKDKTYIFELIHPDNRVIVDYGDLKDLILLSRIDNKIGGEMYHDDLIQYYSKFFTVAKKIKIKYYNDIFSLKKENLNNKEGYVVRMENGFKFNIIFDEYKKIKNTIINISDIKIWELLKNSGDFKKIYDIIPFKFKQDILKIKDNLIKQYNHIERESLKEFYRIYFINDITQRKDFSVEAIKSEYRLILYYMYDKKKYEKIIWKLIKPQNSKPISFGYGKY